MADSVGTIGADQIIAYDKKKKKNKKDKVVASGEEQTEDVGVVLPSTKSPSVAANSNTDGAGLGLQFLEILADGVESEKDNGDEHSVPSEYSFKTTESDEARNGKFWKRSIHRPRANRILDPKAKFCKRNRCKSDVRNR